MSDTLALKKRVEIIEQRLGIVPEDIVADEEASLAAGAEAHVGNAQSDVEPPAEPGSVEDALTAIKDAEKEHETQRALDVANTALQKWPDDEDLLAAKEKLEAKVAKEQHAKTPAHT